MRLGNFKSNLQGHVIVKGTLQGGCMVCEHLIEIDREYTSRIVHHRARRDAYSLNGTGVNQCTLTMVWDFGPSSSLFYRLSRKTHSDVLRLRFLAYVDSGGLDGLNCVCMGWYGSIGRFVQCCATMVWW